MVRLIDSRCEIERIVSLPQHVADAVQGMDRAASTDLLEPLTQAGNQGFNRVRVYVFHEPVEAVLDGSLRYDLAGAAHEQFQCADLAWRNSHNAAVYFDLAQRRIERDVGRLEDAAERAPWPAQQRPQARGEVVDREGFREIVVRAAIETDHTIVDGVTRGQNQDRQRDIVATQFADQIEAVAVRQTKIKDHRVIGESLDRAGTLFGSEKAVDTKAEFAQPLHNRLRQALVVFQQENTHVGPRQEEVC